jgi:hypothetical protein
MKSCANHEEYVSGCFSCYLSQPCSDCTNTATHNGFSRNTGLRGAVCNSCMDWNRPAFARND